jgi:uncharacterized membrane protein
MRGLAVDALERGAPLPARFHRLNRAWFLLGVPAFVIAVSTVWVMVAKTT